MKKLRHLICLGGVFVAMYLNPVGAVHAEETYISSRALTHYTMGIIYDQYGLTEQAASSYKQSLIYDDSSYHVHLKLGSNYAKMGSLVDSIKHLNIVGELQPGNMQSHYLLALIYSTQKKYKKAADEYEIILRTLSDEDPENVEIYGYLGQLYYSQGKVNDAIREFEKVLSLEPKNADILYLLGSLCLEAERRQKAIDLFLEALAINPDHDGTLNSLGYVYAEDEVYLDEALNMITKAIEIDPSNGAYLDSLGWVYYKKGMYEEALKYLQQADQQLNDPVVYEHIGDVYNKMSQFEQAKKYWELSLELLPEQQHLIQKINEMMKEAR